MAKITITLKAIPTHSYLSCDICAGQITDVSTVAEGQTEDGRPVTICDRCLLENDNGLGGLDGFDTILRNEIEKLERMARPVRKGDFRLALFSLLQRIRSRGLVPAKMEIRAA